MKKDIVIPKVENVFLAAIQEWNDDFMDKVWNVYLVNDSDFELENIIILSKAYGKIDGEMRKTSLLRHGFKALPSVSALKIEMIENSVLALNNEFMVTYFIDNTLYDKKFTFRQNTINERATEEVPHIWQNGVVVK